MSLTYVTSYINYYHTPLEINTNRLRIEKLCQILVSRIPVLIFTTVDYIPLLSPLCSHYEQIRIVPLVGTFFEASIIYRMAKLEKPTIQLPKHRSEPKDTFEYMCFLHSKIEFMKQAINLNPFHTTHFAWIDSNLSHMFPSNFPTNYLHELSRNIGKLKII